MKLVTFMTHILDSRYWFYTLFGRQCIGETERERGQIHRVIPIFCQPFKGKCLEVKGRATWVLNKLPSIWWGDGSQFIPSLRIKKSKRRGAKILKHCREAKGFIYCREAKEYMLYSSNWLTCIEQAKRATALLWDGEPWKRPLWERSCVGYA